MIFLIIATTRTTVAAIPLQTYRLPHTDPTGASAEVVTHHSPNTDSTVPDPDPVQDPAVAPEQGYLAHGRTIPMRVRRDIIPLAMAIGIINDTTDVALIPFLAVLQATVYHR